MTVIKKFSKIFGPFMIESTKKVIHSKSHKLFSDTNLTRFNDGFATFSPILLRSLRKLENLVRREMDKISALEILMPSVVNESLLKTSGRINIPDLFKLVKANEKNYILSPTHEEEISNFMAFYKKSLRGNSFECKFYQISHKFRDERRAKAGLLRSKEFIMKDLYCFDASAERSEETYKEIINVYNNFFQLLKVPHIVVKSNPGDIGGLYSNEFHYLTQVGEDRLLLCQNCGFKENCIDVDNSDKCPKCESNNIKIENGIEVGHAFNLGTTYTKPFEATYMSDNGVQTLHMSSFGLGLSRIIAATVEVLSTDENIIWPVSIAPYLVCLIPFKNTMKTEGGTEFTAESFYYDLNNCLPDEVVLFDKPEASIGKRLLKAKKLGFPFIVILGKTLMGNPPCVEVHDCYTDSMDLVQISDLSKHIMDKLLCHEDKKVLMSRNV